MSNTIENQEEIKLKIIERLIEAFTSRYEAAIDISDSDEMKSTQELIEEMSDIEEIFPYEVNRLMEEYGFKIHYNGKNYVWLLKEK